MPELVIGRGPVGFFVVVGEDVVVVVVVGLGEVCGGVFVSYGLF